MFFLKKQIFRTNEQISTPVSSSNTLSLEQQEAPSEGSETMNSTLDQDFSYESPTLFSKFLRNQKLYSGPETFFEDEAWAPEYQSVRLFHRQWGTAEEQISSPSDSQ